MNKIIIELNYQSALKQLKKGIVNGEVLSAIVQFQAQSFIGEDEAPLNQYELGVVIGYMMQFN